MSQTFQDFEIILVTSDEKIFTASVPKNIKIFEIDSSLDDFDAFNVGISLANGEYISFWQNPDFPLQRMFEILSLYTDQVKADFVGMGKYFIPNHYGENDRFEIVNDTGIEQSLVFNKNSVLSLMLQKKITMHLHGKIFLRNFLLRNGIRFAEKNVLQREFLFLLECALKSENILHIPNALYIRIYIDENDAVRFPTKNLLAACVRGLNILDELCKNFSPIQKNTLQDFYLDNVNLKNIFAEVELESLNALVAETSAEQNKIFTEHIHRSSKHLFYPHQFENFYSYYPYSIVGANVEDGIIYNINQTNYKKRCLIPGGIIEAYTQNINEFHQNWWQKRAIAKIIGSFGYQVDVADYRINNINPKYKYDLIYGFSPREKNCCNSGCIKIAVFAGAGGGFEAEKRRFDALKERRGVEVEMRTSAPVDLSFIEECDSIIFFGSEFTALTLGGFDNPPPKYIIKNNGYVSNFGLDFSRKKSNSFLFLASLTSVLKGLDLLLEVFGQKDFPAKLFICSMFKNEPKFCKAYEEELFNRKNIFPIGFVDTKSELFEKIVDECSYVIAPTSTDAMTGAVLTAMSAGLIPLVSIQNGFPEEDVITLPDCDVETIDKIVREYSQKPMSWIRRASFRARKIVSEKYSRQNFIDSVYNALVEILGKKF